MGSLWGHIDEGVVFWGLALWWMINMFRDYIKVGGKKNFQPKLSYTTHIRGMEIPLETYIKIFISVGGFLIELFQEGPVFVDEEGNFQNVEGLQHMSIFCLFFTHSLLDLLKYLKIFYIEGLDYLTFALSFIWYGLIFKFHTEYHPDPLANAVHTMGLLWCFASGISILWELRSSDKFIPCYCKVLSVMSLGTWFIHTPFYLFTSSSFPGEPMNPRWNHDSKENYQVLATLFGVHLCFNIVFTVVCYVILRRCIAARGSRETIQFRRIPSGDAEKFEESNKLSSEEEEL